MARRLSLALLLLLLAAPSAQAVNPEQVIGGSNGKWFSGSLIQQTGLNCSTAILGSAYTEVMVSGIGSYGGVGGVPRVGDEYWTSLLLAIPGNPCGSGSSSVNTSLNLPPGTSYDSSRQIRCFGQGRTASTFSEITNEGWSAFGSSGRYCPTSATAPGLHGSLLNLSFRPLANGQLFQIFVPVKSTQALVGMGNSSHVFQWLTDASAAYANPGLSEVWANVFANSGPSSTTPFVYFSRQDAAIPYWKANAPSTPDLRNRVELFANFYTAGQGGEVCFTIYRLNDMSPHGDCNTPGINFDGTVPAGEPSLVQILPQDAPGIAAGSPNSVIGPNGGWIPIAFDAPGTGTVGPEWDQDMKIVWTFDPSPPGGTVYSAETPFHTLAGPDTDGDGVADSKDSCPSTKGTLSNGCLPGVQGDDDGDGAFGDNDKCPAENGKGALDGCPLKITPPSAIVFGGNLSLKKGAKLKRAQILKSGAVIPVTCTKDSTATATLSVTKAVAKKLKIKTKSKSVAIASAKGACKAAGGGKLKLKVAKKYKKQLTRYKKGFAASLAMKLAGGVEKATAKSLAVKIG